MLYFYIIEPIINRIHPVNDNEYGSARFSTFKEIKSNFNVEKIDSINDSGFPVWYSKDNKYVWFDRQTPHYVYLGSTGSGKSVTCVIPCCSFIANAKNKRSVFITDPKGEIYNATSQMFKNNGYEIITIDFRHPELSNKINLLEPIIKEYDNYIKYNKMAQNEKDNNESYLKYKNLSLSSLAETNRLISSLSQMIMTDKIKEKDPFWQNSSKNLLEGIIGLFLEEYENNNIKKEQITLTSVKKFQNSIMDDENYETLKDYINEKEYGLKSKDSLTSIINSAENTFKSITATFSEKMSLFDDVNVSNITSSSDFEFDILGIRPTALYIIVPDEDKTYYKLITIIIGLIYRELVKLANSNKTKKLPVEIDWILDEFANCPPLPDIEAIVSVARSRGMRFHFFIQSFSQLDNVYGKEVSQIILDNCGLVYLKTNTQNTAEEISKRLGKKTIESKSISQSISQLNYNGNKSTSLMGRDLLTPEEIKQLHYKTIIFPIIGYPIFRDTVMYNKFSCYQKGEVKRIPRSLEKLTNTFYTIETLSSNKLKNKQQNNINLDDVDFNNELERSFESGIKYIESNFKKFSLNKSKIVDENYNTYFEFKTKYILNKQYINLLKDELINNFHVEYKCDFSGTTIDLHKKI